MLRQQRFRNVPVYLKCIKFPVPVFITSAGTNGHNIIHYCKLIKFRTIDKQAVLLNLYYFISRYLRNHFLRNFTIPGTCSAVQGYLHRLWWIIPLILQYFLLRGEWRWKDKIQIIPTLTSHFRIRMMNCSISFYNAMFTKFSLDPNRNISSVVPTFSCKTFVILLVNLTFHNVLFPPLSFIFGKRKLSTYKV